MSEANGFMLSEASYQGWWRPLRVGLMRHRQSRSLRWKLKPPQKAFFLCQLFKLNNCKSQLFNQNLFLYYLEEEPIKSMFGEQVLILQARIFELETELNSKNEKIKDQLEMINTQKKVIALPEAKS